MDYGLVDQWIRRRDRRLFALLCLAWITIPVGNIWSVLIIPTVLYKQPLQFNEHNIDADGRLPREIGSTSFFGLRLMLINHRSLSR